MSMSKNQPTPRTLTVKQIMDASGGSFNEVGSAMGTLNALLGRNASRDLDVASVLATENPLETIQAMNRAAIEGTFYNPESNPFLAQRGPTAGETYFATNPSPSSMIDNSRVVGAVPITRSVPEGQTDQAPAQDPSGYFALTRSPNMSVNDPYLQLQVVGPQGARLTQTGLSGQGLQDTVRRFGYGTEGLASLLPVAEQFYSENPSSKFPGAVAADGYGRGGQLIDLLRNLDQYAVTPAEELASYYNYDYTPG